MKKQLCIITILGLYSNAINAADSMAHVVAEQWSEASKNKPWQFELKNKTQIPIYIQLVTGKNPYSTKEGSMDASSGNAVIPKSYMRINTNITKATKNSEKDSYAGYLRLSGITPQREWYLLIWSEDYAKKAPGQVERAEYPTYLYKFKPNKNRKMIFLTWDNNKLHSPGTTFLSKSASGIPLSGNISDGDIIKEKRNNEFKYVG